MQGIHSFDGFLNILTAFFGEDSESFGIIFFDVNHVVLFVIRYELNKGWSIKIDFLKLVVNILLDFRWA